jgi:Beta-lactamase enzyme family
VIAVRAAAAVALLATALSASVATARPRAHPGPFVTAAMATFLRTRAGDITAAVYNERSGRLFLYRPRVAEAEASVAKVDILATLLYESQQRGEGLSLTQRQLAAAAIEDSDNKDGQLLWNAAGGNPAIGAFNARAGMTQTVLDPAGIWGLYRTTALDQIRLLQQLALPGGLLEGVARSFELGLMRAVTGEQAWGVSAGVLAPASVALKNGWLPIAADGGWQVNSIGQVRGRFRHYLIAVLTSGNPSMTYGAQTIEGISQLVWKAFLPKRFRPRSRPA